jgi:hypothetical protein
MHAPVFNQKSCAACPSAAGFNTVELFQLLFLPTQFQLTIGVLCCVETKLNTPFNYTIVLGLTVRE